MSVITSEDPASVLSVSSFKILIQFVCSKYEKHVYQVVRHKSRHVTVRPNNNNNAEYVETPKRMKNMSCVAVANLHRETIKKDVTHWPGLCIYELCKVYGLPRSGKWYEHDPEDVIKNERVKILWDFTIQTDHEIHDPRPDITVHEKINNCGCSSKILQILATETLKARRKRSRKSTRTF